MNERQEEKNWPNRGSLECREGWLKCIYTPCRDLFAPHMAGDLMTGVWLGMVHRLVAGQGVQNMGISLPDMQIVQERMRIVVLGVWY